MTTILEIAGKHTCGSAVVLRGCNMMRVVTTESQYLQRGDTGVVTQTKTVETYDATKKM